MKPKKPRPRKPRERPDLRRLAAPPPADFYRLPELELRGGNLLTDGCRRVLDVFLPDVVSALYGEVDVRFGFLTEGHTLTLHGLCDRCRGE